MNANEIFNKCIGEKLKPLVLQYHPYIDTFKTYPYHHIFDNDFEENFSALLFDSIVFYAYEKDEIEHDYNRGKLEDLRKSARAAYETRVPKTEKSYDGLMGELALDSFIKCFFNNIEMLYSRVKYQERIPHKEIPTERKGHEIHGYDGMVFSIENGKKYMWVGQVKTGSWPYCFKGIKEDINKSILKHYFSDAMSIMTDIMRAVSSSSDELKKIVDDINDLVLDFSTEQEKLHEYIINYFKENNITIRIPCLLITEESPYDNEKALLESIKKKCSRSFKNFVFENNENLNVEIMLMVFPVRDLEKLRTIFLSERKSL